MDENQNQVQNHMKDEIDLRELLVLFWQKKIFIISITLIMALLSYFYSNFFITPVYNTKLNIVINMPETYYTRYGDYNLPIMSNEQYTNLITSNDVLINTIKDMGYVSEGVTVENLRNRILINAKGNDNQNDFYITVSAKNPEESLNLAQNLYDNFVEFLDCMIMERAINYFSNHFRLQIESLENALISEQERLKANEELLSKMPQTVNQKEAIQAIKGYLPNSDGYILLVDIINPNYTKIESDIVINKQTIKDIENSIRLYNGYLAEIGDEKAILDEYFKSGDSTKLETSIIDVVETSVYLSSPPVASTKKSSPNTVKSTIIGALLGAMVAVLIVFVKDYWWAKDYV